LGIMIGQLLSATREQTAALKLRTV